MPDFAMIGVDSTYDFFLGLHVIICWVTTQISMCCFLLIRSVKVPSESCLLHVHLFVLGKTCWGETCFSWKRSSLYVLLK